MQENNEKLTQNYAIYLRKSRADIEAEAKGEGETLARHEQILWDLANKSGLHIGKIYKEIVSGETIEARPEMQKLLKDVKESKWEGVLVVEVERLARGETMDQGIVAKAFKVSGTKIITPLKIYDPNNEFDEEYFEFGLFMSRREYKVINRRLQKGRELSAKEGKFVGSVPPFGYCRVKIKGDKGYTLKKNKEANIVKLIYDLYAYDNLSLNEITKRLNQMGIRPRKNNEWSVSTIKDILANPVYIGKIKWYARKEVKVYRNETLIKTRPRNSNYILVEGLHEAIIEEKTWKIVSAKRSLNSVPVVNNQMVQNPLSGLIICDKCGKKMKRRSYSQKGKEATLYCDNPKCDNIGSKFYYVEEKVIEGLKKWLQDYKLDYDKYLEEINTYRIKTIKKTIASLKEEEVKERNKLLTIYTFLEEGTYTKEVFQERKEIILRRIQQIKYVINENQKKLTQERSRENKKNIPQIRNIIDIYDLLKTPEEKNMLLKMLLFQVTYLKTEKAVKKNSDPTNFTITLYPKVKNCRKN